MFSNCVTCIGKLLEILSPVKATASSSYETSSGLCFAPQLAIQAKTSYVWANCFVSTKEINPWFKLEFKSERHVFNVRLGVRNQASVELPRDYKLTEMASLSVYVSNSSVYDGSNNSRCDSPWKYKNTKIIDFKCGRKLSGKFVHFIVPSSSPVYLLICSIVLNKDDGTMSSLVKPK